ncbi:MAG: cytochrome c [Oricola sp.]
MIGRTGFKIAATLAFSLSCAGAIAHSGATGIVAERMEAMKKIAGRMKEIGAMVRGKREYDAGAAAAAAAAIARHAGRMPSLFPEGSDGDPSEALPAIWTEWDDFIAFVEALEASAAELSDAARQATDADAIRPHFATVGQACSACHEDFRMAD